MSTITLTDYQSPEIEEMECFEKMAAAGRTSPGRRSHSASRRAHSTPASRRASKQYSRKHSGVHRRMRKRTMWQPAL